MSTPGIDVPGLGCGLAVLRDGKLLLYRRVKAPEAGCWNIVGGKVDHMERAIDAARREAEEESGIATGTIDFLCISEQIITQERQHWLSLIYVTDDFSGEPRVMEPEKLPEFGWFALDDLPSPLSRFAADAVDALIRRQPARNAAS
ncbi:NUDIX domain-containing protein [Shinella sp. AETb1-6]|jgi:ADP-ribose pyrophosphatase YjhB (NUDIX family)|uniref:NUDIX domain-containing protein n=1 Tax=Shinella sp. AETb1-6 TaxID=2692210 RepID=UPI0013701D7D|nr:NUDIX domain-containing protein [Shinella sp. AETb1-6]MXN53598.1 NUDIX domain-containing protein [Shinella sp. AETb1-6]WLS08236.1 NUDIX domain-containing protein [Shinella sumterensis]